jgi:hypothetical protein
MRSETVNAARKVQRIKGVRDRDRIRKIDGANTTSGPRWRAAEDARLGLPRP